MSAPRATTGSSHPTRPAPDWAGASVLDVTGLLLLAFVRRDAASMTFEPTSDGYRAVMDDDLERAFDLPKDVGEGVAARLAIMTGLDVARPEQRMGRLRLRAPAVTADLVDVVAIGRTSFRGLALEVRRLAAPNQYAIVKDDDIVEAVEGVPVAAARSDAAYEIHRELGRGGMAIVYLGTHRLLEKQVAIKILNEKSAANPSLAASLIREGRAASRVQHPGVVGVTDFGTLRDGRAYLVMEYVESDTLSGAMKSGPLPLVRALRIAREVADALEAVRLAGVVHGDIKPSNVFLMPGDRIKLVDFGAARVGGVGPELEDGLFVATPAYLAPECVLGQPADHRIDVYALGCVLYRMITGRAPFHGITMAETLHAQVNAPIPKTSKADGPLLSPVDSVIALALAKNPDNRYPSAGAMRDDIDRAIDYLLARERAGERGEVR